MATTEKEAIVKTLTREEVQSRIDEKKPINLIEASNKEDFDKAHLPGAFRMTADEAKAGAQHRLQDKNAEVIAYCGGNGCDASTKLATELESQGYSNVSVFKGGKAEWNEAGFPTENGNKAATANSPSDGTPFGDNRQTQR